MKTLPRMPKRRLKAHPLVDRFADNLAVGLTVAACTAFVLFGMLGGFGGPRFATFIMTPGLPWWAPMLLISLLIGIILAGGLYEQRHRHLRRGTPSRVKADLDRRLH